MKYPFFTIITATHNAAATLPRLLDSLASQTCRDFNWIVQDGMSTDNTMQVIASYAGKIPSILVESTNDTGIYDAWNKALDRSVGNGLGKWVLFLGADDLLAAPDVLEKTKNCLEGLAESVLYALGDGVYIDGEIRHYRRESAWHSFITRKKWMPLGHSSLFTNSHIFSNNRFDPVFKISGDYEFILKTWKFFEQAIDLQILVTRIWCDGISNSPQLHKKKCQEVYLIQKRHVEKTLRFLYSPFFIHRYFIYDIQEFHIFCKKIFCKTKIGSFAWSYFRSCKRFFMDNK